jgi:hypothetical protein
MTRLYGSTIVAMGAFGAACVAILLIAFRLV